MMLLGTVGEDSATREKEVDARRWRALFSEERVIL